MKTTLGIGCLLVAGLVACGGSKTPMPPPPAPAAPPAATQPTPAAKPAASPPPTAPLEPAPAAEPTARVIFEISSHGGFHPSDAPDPFVLLRVWSDGRAGAHCGDYQWVEGKLTAEESNDLRQMITDSGFLDLATLPAKGKAARPRPDVPVTTYTAEADGRSKTYSWAPTVGETASPVEPILKHLRDSAQAVRDRLCLAH